MVSEDPAGRAPPGPEEVGLIDTILGNLPMLLAECERRFNEFNAKWPHVRDEVTNPHVWIARSRLWGLGSGYWSFVVEHRESDYGWHLEFDGLDFVDMWGGD